MTTQFRFAGVIIDFENAPSLPYDWTKVADFAIAEAVKLSDKTGIAFSHGDYGVGRTYTPRPTTMTKDQALELLESGQPLEHELRSQIAKAIREGKAEGSWQDSYIQYGWVSSSDNC